MHNTEAKHKH